MSYLILSKDRSDGIACWWRPDSRGYTNNVAAAGRYSKDEAFEICRASHGKDVPIPEEQIGISIGTRLIVDIGDHGNWDALNKLREEFESTAVGKNAALPNEETK